MSSFGQTYGLESLIDEATLPGRLPSNMFERVSLTGEKLATLDIEAALRALVAPDTLSPTELQRVADKVEGEDPSRPLEFLTRAVTNPLVLGGLALSLRYPVPTLKNLLKFSKKLTVENQALSPLAKVIGSLEEIFPGSDIPKIYRGIERATTQKTETTMTRLMEILHDGQRAGVDWQNPKTKTLMVAKLSGLDQGKNAILKPIKEGTAFDEMADKLRSWLDDIHETVHKAGGPTLKKKAFGKYADKRTQEAVTRYKAELSREKGKRKAPLKAFKDLDPAMRGQLLDMGFSDDYAKYVENYWPHQLTEVTANFDEAIKNQLKATQKVMESGLYDEKKVAERLGQDAGSVVDQSVLRRTGGLLPDISQLEKYLDDSQWREGAKSKFKKELDAHRKKWTKTNRPGSGMFSLDFDEVIKNYVHLTSRTYGWSVEKWRDGLPLGDALLSRVNALEKGSTKDITRAAMMKSSYIPLALGRQTYKQMMNNALWSQYKVRAADMLETGPLSKLPSSVKNWWKKQIESDKGIGNLANLSHRATGWMYVSALGGSTTAPIYNMMQTILTTYPTIGSKATLEGLESVFKKAPKYFKARSRGLSHDSAIAQTFPEFLESGLTTAPVTEEAVDMALKNAWSGSLGALPGKTARAVDKVKRALMSFFQGSESMVRLTAFEGSYKKGIREGLSKAEAIDAAADVTTMTQYLSGPASTPAMMREWPSWARQFMQFPLRTAGFMAMTAPRLGSATQAGFLGRNWGTLGRVALGSGITYEAGQAFLDKDLSHGLMFGALPQVNPEAPFAPIPMVPPLVGLVGGAALDLARGETEQTQFSLPLLVPGGLQMARIAQAASPSMAQFFGRGYADWENKDERGRVPVYTKHGQFRGYYSPMQVWTESILPGGAPLGEKEKVLQNYLLKQRDEIRMIRRNFIDALITNDTREADRINEAFKKKYPMLNGMSIEKKDLEAARMRLEIPRMERMLQTLPEDVRPLFGQLIRQMTMNQGQDLLGIDPYLLQSHPTVKSRDPWRTQRPVNPTQSLWTQRMHNQYLLGYAPPPQSGLGTGGQVNTGQFGSFPSGPAQYGFGASTSFGLR